ncbi:MAG: glycosyltransferase family 39 protein [Pyrinomonadaceae bacterium]
MEDPKKFRLAIGALCAAYIAARVWQLTDACLWFDEIFSVHAAEQSWREMWSFVAQDLIHPPLFYALLKIWIGVGGDGLLWLRLFPVLFSALVLIPFIYLGRELKLRSSAILLALALFATNGALIRFSQTLRMYTLLMFLSLLSIWLFARYFNRGKSWIWLVAVNVLLIYTHYFGWLIVGGEFLTILLFQRIKIGRAALMVGIAAAAFVPWVIAILNRDQISSDLAQNISWQTRPGIREVTAFLMNLVEPFYAPISNIDPSSVKFIAVPMLLLFAIAIGMFISSKKSDEEKSFLRFATVFIAFPVLLAFVFSWMLPNSVWGTRHLIAATPLFLMLVAAAVISLEERWLRIGAISVILILSGAAFVLEFRRDDPEQVWCAWAGVANEIAAAEATNAEPPAIYSFENLAAYHLWFAERKQDSPKVVVVKGVPVRTDDQTYFLPRGFDKIKTVNIDEIHDPEIWTAFRVFRLGEEIGMVEAFTSRGYFVCSLKQKAYGTNRVFWVKLAKDPARCAGPT